jgi:hypothetical protein
MLNYSIKALLIILFLFPLIVSAQVENVIVETYYIADANDATDTTGGGIEVGTKTYRIYVDLKEGSKLKKVYGDQYHTLMFKSTEIFFNNKVDGQSFAKDFNRNRFKENTVALDTWLTIGQISNSSNKVYHGILKQDDRDGSFIGGSNNSDGGSALLSQGLLNNINSEIAIALTQADGIDTMNYLLSNWASYGILDPITSTDSTVFGSLVEGNEFISNNAGLQNSGAIGVLRNENKVLIAQLTTKGELSFELNLEVEEPDGIDTKIIKYVARKDTLLEDEKLSPFLRYPFLCGCTDANYIEYSEIYACDYNDSCKTPIVLGCMDTSACNYDPKANFNVQGMCCYPGYCNDRELAIVCPEINSDMLKFYIYPNPATDLINLNIWLNEPNEIFYDIKNIFDVSVVAETNIGEYSGNTQKEINIAELQNGIYYLSIRVGDKTQRKIFIKN